MNQLITVNPQLDPKAFESLSESLKPFAAARVGQKQIKDITDFELKSECGRIVTVAYSEMGQFGITADMIEHQKTALFNEIRGNKIFSGFSLQEVKNAVNLGIRGESGPFFGLCAKSFYQFLKHYSERKERTEALNKYLDEIKKPFVTEKPLTQIFKETAQSTLSVFNEYKKDGTLPIVSFPFYDFLWNNLKLINWSESEKVEIKKSGQELYKKELAEKVISRQIKKSDYELIISNLNNATCLNRIKKVGLKRYFDKCINGGFDLETELKKHIL